MFKHLLKYNETIFLMIVLLLFSSSVLYFNYLISDRMLTLKHVQQTLSDKIVPINKLLKDIQTIEANPIVIPIKVIAPEPKLGEEIVKEVGVINTDDTSSTTIEIPDSNIPLIEKKLEELNLEITSWDMKKSEHAIIDLSTLPESEAKNKTKEWINQVNTGIQDLIKNSPNYIVGNSLKMAELKNNTDEIQKNISSLNPYFNKKIDLLGQELKIIQVTSFIGILSLFGVLIVIVFGKLIKTDQEIAVITEENNNILRNVKEGLFLINSDLTIGKQSSSVTNKIIGHNIKEGNDFKKVLEELVDIKTYNNTLDYINLLFTSNVKESLILTLNPLNEIKTLDQNGQEKFLSIHFNKTKIDGVIVALLVTVQDITQQIVIAKQLKEAKLLAHKEIESILNTIAKNKNNLSIFIEHISSVIDEINSMLRNMSGSNTEYRKELNYISRMVHKIKGEASSFGFEFFYESTHAFENVIAGLLQQENITGDLMLTVAVNLETLIQKTAIIKKIIVQSEDISAKPTSFSDNVKFLIKDMNEKLNKNIILEENLIKLYELPKDKSQKIQDIIIQLVRNSGFHGIQKNQENTDKGIGKISVSLLRLADNSYSIQCKDNGNGINVQDIKNKVSEKYNITLDELNQKSDKEMYAYIFKPDFSTSNEVNLYGGRGIGLDLVAELIKEIDGKLILKTTANIGTEFIIEFKV